MRFTKKFTIFFLLFIVGLFIVLFIYREKDIKTGQNSIKFATDAYKRFKKGIDLIGGVSLVYKIDYSDYEKTYSNQQELAQAKAYVRNVLEKEIDRRVNSLGVSDYTANFKNMNGDDYIEVQIGGISDIDTAKSLLGKTIKLDFKLPFEGEPDQKTVSNRKLLAEKILQDVVLSGKDMATYFNPDENIFVLSDKFAKGNLPDFIKSNFEQISSLNTGSYFPKLLDAKIQNLSGRAILKYNGTSIENTTGTSLTGTYSGVLYNFDYVFVANKPMWELAKDPKTNNILNGGYFLQALVEPNQTGRPGVRIDFTSQGRDIWCNITQENVGKQVAIFVGDRKVSDPVIQEKICGGSTMITFGTNDYNQAMNEAKQLVKELNYTLPVPLVLTNESKISPLLGDYALKGAIIAGIVGFVLVFVFMSIMYGFRYGLYTAGGLIMFYTILFAFVKMMDYSFSLAGIAAILLNIGMAVDANILIYERLREEIKTGKSMHVAIQDAYQRSYFAIRDGNSTTLFVGLLLFILGISVFKGFGAMLVLNIVLTLGIVMPIVKEFLINFNKK